MTCGEDSLLKIWHERPASLQQHAASDSAAPKIRFSLLVPPQPSKSLLPWVSISLVHQPENATYLAAITRSGNLAIFEPADHDDLERDNYTFWHDWMADADFHVLSVGKVGRELLSSSANGAGLGRSSIPRRGQDTSFSVAWHREAAGPCWTAVKAGLDKKSLGLAVACMEGVKIFRTDGRRRLYLAAEWNAGLVEPERALGDGSGVRNKKQPSLVRDTTWSNGSVKGWDTIATASKDGYVRIWYLKTPNKLHKRNREEAGAGVDSMDPGAQAQQTSLTASPLSPHSQSLSSGPSSIFSPDDTDPTHVMQNVEKAAEFHAHPGGAAWRVSFSLNGEMLVSTGDDGAARCFKRAVSSFRGRPSVEGKWMEWGDISGPDGVDEQEDCNAQPISRRMSVEVRRKIPGNS